MSRPDRETSRAWPYLAWAIARTLADNVPEVMLSLVTCTAVPSGLTSAATSHLRASEFPYVIPA